jgi:hypothetical protein
VEQAIWVGYGLLVAVCWALWLRALAVARRSRGLLDWGLGVVVLCAGGIGCPLTFLPSLMALSPELRAHVLASGIAGIGLGSIALYLVNWRYFRPHSVLAALVCSTGSFVIAWSFLAEVLTAGFAWGRDRVWLTLGGTACWVPYAWGSLEMFREAARRLRRPSAPRGEAGHTLLLYGVAQGGVALLFPPGIASAYQSGGGSLPPLLLGSVAGVAIAAVVAAGIAFAAAGRRRPDGAGRGEGAAR